MQIFEVKGVIHRYVNDFYEWKYGALMVSVFPIAYNFACVNLKLKYLREINC